MSSTSRRRCSANGRWSASGAAADPELAAFETSRLVAELERRGFRRLPAKRARASATAKQPRRNKNAELDAAAAHGIVPEKPDVTSHANHHYQKRFDRLAELAAGLTTFKRTILAAICSAITVTAMPGASSARGDPYPGSRRYRGHRCRSGCRSRWENSAVLCFGTDQDMYYTGIILRRRSIKCSGDFYTFLLEG
jgi:hypothetical protein